MSAFLKSGLILLALVGCTPSVVAQGGVPLWTNRYTGPGNGNDGPAAIAVDSGGKVYVTGSSDGGASSRDYLTLAYSGDGTLLWEARCDDGTNGYDAPAGLTVDSNRNVFVTGGSSGAYGTVAYSSDGVPLWTNRYNGLSAHGIAVDSSGNVFVTGQSARNGPGYYYATIKYSNAGVPLWTNRYDGPESYDVANAIAVDGSGNVFVTGQSVGPVANGTCFQFVTIKYSNAGEPLWTNRYSECSAAVAIAVDSGGNVFVTGHSYNGNSEDYATIAYSNAGVPLWTNRYDGPGNGYDFSGAIVVDSVGNVFVTGQSMGNGTGFDYATIKYSNAGVPLWTNRYDGPASSFDAANAIAVDGSGNVFVTGSSYNDKNSDYATIAYSNAGVPLWTNRYNGPGNGDDGGSAIAVDDRGNVFVTGDSDGGATGFDYVTIKYSSSLIPPAHIDFQKLNNQLVLSWTNSGFTLQSAPAVTGPFTNLPAATSPYTNPLTAPRQFFRLASP